MIERKVCKNNLRLIYIMANLESTYDLSSNIFLLSLLSHSHVIVKRKIASNHPHDSYPRPPVSGDYHLRQRNISPYRPPPSPRLFEYNPKHTNPWI